jgi:2-oxoglutarate ferredoxin oxidoreductase subunit alpha
LVENNATGLLGDVIASQTGIVIEDKILRYDGRPFVPEDLVTKIKKIR